MPSAVSAVIETLLEVAPIFAGLTAEERAELLDIAGEETYAAGLEIVSRGSFARNLVVLAEGTVEVLEGEDTDEQAALATLIPPCSFGEVPFFEASEYHVTVRTLTPVRLLSIERSGFDALIKKQSLAAYKVALNVLLKLGDQMRRVEDWVAEVLGHNDLSKKQQWAEFRAKLYQGWEI